MRSELATGKALGWVRVLDLSRSEAGAMVTQTLAWYGAEVIKIEEPARGDPVRDASTDTPGADSHYFIMLNCNKRSATLNLEDERGREILRRMIPKAQVFVEDSPFGAMDRLGFSYQEVEALNPGIVYARIKAYGPDGPFAGYPAVDAVVQAMGGVISTTGMPDAPVKPGPPLAYTGAALHCISGILAALYQKRMAGLGQLVEVAMQDSVVDLCRISYASQQIVGRAGYRVGNNVPLAGPAAPANVYHCTPFGPNDYCYVFSSRAHNKHWERLLEVMGREDLLGDERYATQEARAARVDEVDQIVGEWTRQYTKDEVMRIVGDAGIPTGAVLTADELSDDPYLRQRGLLVAVQHPVRGEVVVPSWPVKTSELPIEVVSAPILGEHSAEVYGEWLGLGEAELERLRVYGVI